MTSQQKKLLKEVNEQLQKTKNNPKLQLAILVLGIKKWSEIK